MSAKFPIAVLCTLVMAGPAWAQPFGWGVAYGGPGWRGGGACYPRFSVGFSFWAPPVDCYYPAYPAPAYRCESYYSGAALVARAQKRLWRLGYYRASIDGQFGPITSEALADYQSDYGLPVTGRLDWRTRRSLGI